MVSPEKLCCCNSSCLCSIKKTLVCDMPTCCMVLKWFFLVSPEEVLNVTRQYCKVKKFFLIVAWHRWSLYLNTERQNSAEVSKCWNDIPPLSKKRLMGMYIFIRELKNYLLTLQKPLSKSSTFYYFLPTCCF